MADVLNLTEGQRLRIHIFHQRLKARIWNAGVLLWWYRLWIRADTSHESFAYDQETFSAMPYKRRVWYQKDLTRRIKVARWRAESGFAGDWGLIVGDVIGHIVPFSKHKLPPNNSGRGCNCDMLIFYRNR